MNIILGIFWGTLLTALVIALIKQAAFYQKRKKWAKDIKPGRVQWPL